MMEEFSLIFVIIAVVIKKASFHCPVIGIGFPFRSGYLYIFFFLLLVKSNRTLVLGSSLLCHGISCRGTWMLLPHILDLGIRFCMCSKRIVNTKYGN